MNQVLTNLTALGRRLRLRSSNSPNGPRLDLVALCLITAVGAVLRAYHLGFKPLRFDEAMFYWIGQGDLPAIIRDNALLTSEPPLFAILTALVSRISDTEVALRLIPFIAGVVAIPVMYFLARNWLSVGGALAASIMVAFSPNQVRYSQSLREYSLSSLFTMLVILSFVNFIDKKTWRSATILALATAVGLFIHYSLALVVLAINAVFLVYVITMKTPRTELVLKWLVVQAVWILTALALYTLGLRQQLDPVLTAGYIQGGLWEGSSLRSAIEFAYGGGRSIIELTYPGYLFTLMLYTGSIVLIVLHRRKPFPYLIATPIVLVVFASLLRLYPLSGGSQNLFLTPLIILLAAAAIDYLVRVDTRRLTVAVFLALIVWRAVPSLRAYYPTEGGSAVGNIVKSVYALSEPGDPVYLCIGDDFALRYYVGVRYPMPLNPVVEGIRGGGSRDYIDQVDTMLKQHGRAWMVIFDRCGDMTPLLDHVAREWNVELIEKRYPNAELYYVH